MNFYSDFGMFNANKHSAVIILVDCRSSCTIRSGAELKLFRLCLLIYNILCSDFFSFILNLIFNAITHTVHMRRFFLFKYSNDRIRIIIITQNIKKNYQMNNETYTHIHKLNSLFAITFYSFCS